jgi:hypothetical protein
MKTIPFISLNSIPAKRNILLIHSDDRLWAIKQFHFSDNNLIGKMYQDSVEFPKLKVTHIYVAPISAIKIEDNNLSFPIENIGKVDYFALDWWKIGGTLFIIFMEIIGLAGY